MAWEKFDVEDGSSYWDYEILPEDGCKNSIALMVRKLNDGNYSLVFWDGLDETLHFNAECVQKLRVALSTIPVNLSEQGQLTMNDGYATNSDGYLDYTSWDMWVMPESLVRLIEHKSQSGAEEFAKNHEMIRNAYEQGKRDALKEVRRAIGLE